jgi:hypothetical protein
MSNQIYFKIAGKVDLDMLNMFAVSTYRALPPRWPPQCSCVVIESSFDPGERLQAPGSLWFHQIFKILILFVLYFKNYKRQVVSCLGYRTALTDTILKGDHTRIISANLVEIGSVVSEEKNSF